MDIYFTFIADPVNGNGINNNATLRRISIENTGVTWLSNATFACLVNLEYLRLTGNHRMVISPKNIFQGLIKMRILTIKRW